MKPLQATRVRPAHFVPAALFFIGLFTLTCAQFSPRPLDLAAAWSAALANGPVPPALISTAVKPRFFPSAALSTLRVSLTRGSTYVINIPTGQWAVNGSITVQAGQTLVLQGLGGFPDTPDSAIGNDTAPSSIWVLSGPNGTTPLINVEPGGVLYFRNVTLVGPRFGPLNTPLTGVPTFVGLPDGRSVRQAAFALEAVAIVLDSCDLLEAYQTYTCTKLLEDLDVPWPSVEIEPGWMSIYRIQSTRANVSMDRALFSCTWPPPRLTGILQYGSSSPANQPSAPPIKYTPLYNASVLPLLPSGFPSGLVPPLRPTDNNSLVLALPFTRPLKCVARRASNTAQLMRAVIALQALSSQYVIVSINNNMTWNDTGTQTDWPTSELALRIYRNVTLQGRHVLTSRVTEIDLQSTLRNIFWIQPDTGYLRFQQLTLTNMPCGSRLFFPASMLTVMMWHVAWDRSQDDRVYVDVRNSTLVQPLDNFNYTSYWVGIQASPIPQVRALADWQTEMTFSGSLEVSADSHSLFIQRRWGRGIQWFNTTLTDLPVVAPLRFASVGCGLQNLVPGDPYYPYTKITPVFTGAQLLAALADPPTPVLMLLDNITLSGNDTAVSVIKQYNSRLDPTRTALPLIEDIDPLNVTYTSVPGISDQPINYTGGPLTIVGWRLGYTVLDLAGVVGRVQLQGAKGPNAQPVISLKRMTLTGLGPADPSQRAGDLRNVTSSVWFFNFDRGQELLSLQNVTLVIPSTELGLVQSISNGSAGPSLSLVGGSLISPDPSAFIAGLPPLTRLKSAIAGARVRFSQPGTALGFAEIEYTGISAANTTLIPVLNPDLAALVVVKGPPQGLELPHGLTTDPTAVVPVLPPSDPVPVPSGGGGGGSGLKAWQIAVLSVCCAIAIMLAGLLLWWVRKARRRAERREASLKLPQDSLLYPRPHNEGSSGKHPKHLTATGTVVVTPLTDPASPHSAERADSDGTSASTARRASSVLPEISSGDLHSGTASLLPSQTSPLLASQLGMSMVSQGAQGDGSVAPDEEIRQLVHTQRERSQARSGSGSKSLGQELEGVTLDSVLGQGSFGVVYLGRWRGMRVAVKTLMFHDSGPAARRARQRAVNEAAINTLLSHDCICNMYAYDLRPVAATGLPDERFSVNYRLYIIQEYCDAGSLAHAIDAGAFMDLGKRNLAAIIEVALQIARGLEYIHENSVIHGDLSSGNVMLRTASDTPLGFQAKLCDFGLSRFLEGPEQSHISNARQGTPFYMAPEVLAHGIISREADVFSLGVILWELINATQPPWRDPAMKNKAVKDFETGQYGDIQNANAFAYRMLTVKKGATAPLETRSPGAAQPASVPRDCPKGYADMVASCIHSIPKVRPHISVIVHTLERLHRDVLRTYSKGRRGVKPLRLEATLGPPLPGSRPGTLLSTRPLHTVFTIPESVKEGASDSVSGPQASAASRALNRLTVPLASDSPHNTSRGSEDSSPQRANSCPPSSPAGTTVRDLLGDAHHVTVPMPGCGSTDGPPAEPPRQMALFPLGAVVTGDESEHDPSVNETEDLFGSVEIQSDAMIQV